MTRRVSLSTTPYGGVGGVEIKLPEFLIPAQLAGRGIPYIYNFNFEARIPGTSRKYTAQGSFALERIHNFFFFISNKTPEVV